MNRRPFTDKSVTPADAVHVMNGVALIVRRWEAERPFSDRHFDAHRAMVEVRDYLRSNGALDEES